MTAKISSLECFEDEALMVHVEVVNPKQASAPTCGPTDDFTIRLAPGIANPSLQQIQTFVNGRHSAREVYTYYFEALPARSGRLTLPSFSRVDNGTTYTTRPINVTVRPRTGPRLMFCKVLAERDTVFVGEPVRLTLEIWVRKFSQARIGTLDEVSMWQLGFNGASQLGVFANIASGADVRDETIADANGAPHPYHVYSLKAIVRPETPGPLDLGNIVIAWSYPVELARALLRRYDHIQQPRLLRAVPEAPRLVVKAIPTEGCPPDYNGAIGQFTVRATAKPTTVTVGDPITLTITVVGNVPLDQLSAPRLNQVAALTRDFSISDESLAGDVLGDRKNFTLTIRALSEDVKEIPPIPFSYFNPRNEKYETVHTRPIPLTVQPPKRLALLPMPDASAAGANERARISETSDGLLANVADADLLLADHRGGFGAGSMVLLGSMPGLYAAAWLVMRRQDRLRADTGLRRRTQAYDRARKALKAAAAGRGDVGDAVFAALTGYVADRFNAPAAGITRDEAIRLLDARQTPAPVRDGVNALLEQIEFARYAGASATDGAAAHAALKWLDELERLDLR